MSRRFLDSAVIRPEHDEPKFWSKVAKAGDDECWQWTGRVVTLLGYGQIDLYQRPSVYAHRYSFELAHGPIPQGMFVCHRCDNPPCVNPAHLFLGTPLDNSQDMSAKGRARGNPTTRGSAHHKAKLTEDQVLAIRRMNASQRAIAAAFGVSQPLVGQIRRRELWKHLP